jgi:hypothetical protein
MNRRVFVGGAFAGLAAPRPARPKAGDIPMRTLGRTGQKLSIIGQGGARFGRRMARSQSSSTWTGATFLPSSSTSLS